MIKNKSKIIYLKYSYLYIYGIIMMVIIGIYFIIGIEEKNWINKNYGEILI